MVAVRGQPDVHPGSGGHPLAGSDDPHRPRLRPPGRRPGGPRRHLAGSQGVHGGRRQQQRTPGGDDSRPPAPPQRPGRPYLRQRQGRWHETVQRRREPRLPQARLQLLRAASHHRPHGTHRTPQHLGDLRLPQPRPVPQHQHRPPPGPARRARRWTRSRQRRTWKSTSSRGIRRHRAHTRTSVRRANSSAAPASSVSSRDVATSPGHRSRAYAVKPSSPAGCRTGRSGTYRTPAAAAPLRCAPTRTPGRWIPVPVFIVFLQGCASMCATCTTCTRGGGGRVAGENPRLRWRA